MGFKNRNERIVEKGYFHEMVELQKTKGKPFVAEQSLNDAMEAVKVPALAAETLNGGELALPAALEGKVTLLALSFKQFGFMQLESWAAPFSELAEGTKGGALQVVQLSAVDKGFIANLLRGSMINGTGVEPPTADGAYPYHGTQA